MAQGQYDKQYWIESHPFLAWVPAKVVKASGKKMLLQSLIDDHRETVTDPIEVDESSMLKVPDLLSLGCANPGAVLHTLRMRHEEDRQ